MHGPYVRLRIDNPSAGASRPVRAAAQVVTSCGRARASKMCVHGAVSLIVLLCVAGAVVLGLAVATPVPSASSSGETVRGCSGSVVSETPPGSLAVALEEDLRAERNGSDDSEFSSRPRLRRRTRDQDDQSNIESSISLWEWLKGRDKPEDNCMLMAIGGVASGGFLTGAFVGAGIGSIFTGPGAIVGGIVGGLVGMFGGLSVGARAGAVACENV